MRPDEIPSPVRPPAPPHLLPRCAALLAAVLLPLVAGCGATGDGSTVPGGPGGPGGGRTPQFVEPSASVDIPMGAHLDVRVTGLPANASVVLALDTDGDPRTANDKHPLGAPLTASAAGVIDASVSTDGVPQGTRMLLALPAGGTDALAFATATVTLRTHGELTIFGSAGTDVLNEAKPLANGRIAVMGTVDRPTTYLGAAGPITLQGAPPVDSWVGVVEHGALVDARLIGGPDVDFVQDIAAGPDGGFSAVGVSWRAIPVMGPGVERPTTVWEGEDVGFLGTYDGDAGFDEGLLAWGHTESGVAADAVTITSVAHGPDGARWIAVEAESAFAVGGRTLARPGTAGGAVIFRVGATSAVVPPFASVLGDATVVGLELDRDGNLVVAGTASGSVRFEQVLVDFAVKQPFVARFAPSGVCLGVLAPTQTNGKMIVRELAVGPDGVFVVGSALGTTTFGSVTVAAATSGNDGFVLALAPDLTPRWARLWRGWKAAGTPLVPVVDCGGVAALPDGGCAVSGGTFAGADIEGVLFGSGLFTDSDGAVARYGPDGDLVWVVGFLGGGDQFAARVAADAEGCLLIPGTSAGPMTLTDRDGAVRTVAMPFPSTMDGFLIRLDPDGRLR